MQQAPKILCVFFVFLSFSMSAKQKDKQWQVGKVLDTGRSSTYAGQIGDATGTTPVNRVYETYVIETADYVYECQERIKWKWSKAAVLTVNGPVQFAIEKDHLYIKSEDGSEHDTKIIKKILKPAKTSSSSEPKN